MTGHIDPNSPLIPAQEMVLPTLQGDGKRRWINPALSTGKYWKRRRLLAYGLIAFFVTLPHLRYAGKPLVLLDIVSREFTFFGHTFYPTDSGLLLLLMLTVFFSIMFLTAVGGRLWCGWGCPQTVYLEFLFRPIDRLFSGTIGKGGKPRGTLNAALRVGRFQSVMLDRKSLIVTYDVHRGEPRHKGKATGPSAGDCIDCGHCTAVCPTGIDIRNGLQMECIHCTQCIDACDTIMHRIGKPVGLIRYSSQDALEGKKHSWVRPRTLIYPLLVLVTSTLFLALLSTKFAFDARVLSSPGAPYAINSARMLQNNFRVRLRNRTDKTETYAIRMFGPASASVQWSDEAPTLKPNESKLVPIMITAPVGLTAANHGKIEAEVQITDQTGNERKISVMLLGPG